MDPRNGSSERIPARDPRNGTSRRAIAGNLRRGNSGHGVGHRRWGHLFDVRNAGRHAAMGIRHQITFWVAAVDPRSPPSKCVPGVRDPGEIFVMDPCNGPLERDTGRRFRSGVLKGVLEVRPQNGGPGQVPVLDSRSGSLSRVSVGCPRKCALVVQDPRKSLQWILVMGPCPVFP